MAQQYDQKIKVPRLDDDDFLNRRYSVITENETVQRRGSEQQYIGRRNKTLRSMHVAQTEQDATILAAIHDDHEQPSTDNWSIGTRYRKRNPPPLAYTPAKQVAMTIQPAPSNQQQFQQLHTSIHNSRNNKKSSSSGVASVVSASTTDFDDRKQTQSISQTSTTSKYNDEDIYSEMTFEKFKPSFCIHFIVFILISVVCGGLFYYYYLYEWPYKIYYKMSYAAILWFLSVLFLFLNLIDKFHKFHEFFSGLCCHHAPMIFIALTIIFGLIEYVLWSLVDENLLLTTNNLGDKNFTISLIVIDVIYYCAFFFLFCSMMSNWPTISYYFSESQWIQGLLYMSIVGYIFIWLCRKLRKPNVKDIISWYKQHPTQVIIVEIMRVTSWLFLIFNILFGCMTPIFGEAVAYVSSLGTIYAIGGYIILSFLIMLTPLMPGSIIDIAGGFLFVFVLVLNHSFHISLAWIIAVFSIILLHYCGACAQWFIGSMRVVQFYLNRSLPAELLAASDSVLEEANCGTVGLIGYIFLDTANGLNQGRINMRFWTQLCSEWSCIPNAFAVVSLGATIALPAIYPQEYESYVNNNGADTGMNNNSEYKYIFVLLDVLIPLLALIAGLIQFSGLTLAATTLGKSIDTDDYMMAREKWTAVQFFYRVSGYVPSKKGWENDVLQLATPNKQYPTEYQRCLFEDVMPLQRWYVFALDNKRIKQLQKKSNTKISITKLKLLILEKYRTELDNIRNLHYTTIEAQYDKLIAKEWLINPHDNKDIVDDDDNDDVNRYFSAQNIKTNTNRKCFQIFLLIVFVLTFWMSFYRIYWQAAFFDRVAKGFKIFEETTEWYDWVAFCVFLVAWVIYNHYEILQSFRNCGRQCCFMIKCCRINKNIESRFQTPYFDTKKFDVYGNQQTTSFTSISTQNIENNLYSQQHLKQDNNDNINNNNEDDDVTEVGF